MQREVVFTSFFSLCSTPTSSTSSTSSLFPSLVHDQLPEPLDPDDLDPRVLSCPLPLLCGVVTPVDQVEVPFVHQLVPVVDIKAKRMTVIPPDFYESEASQ